MSGAKTLAAVSYRVFYVWKRNLVSYQRFAIPTFLASLGEPLLYLVAMGIGMGSYMGLIDGQPYLKFLAPGLLVSTAMFAATYECTFSAYVRLNMEKVYPNRVGISDRPPIGTVPAGFRPKQTRCRPSGRWHRSARESPPCARRRLVADRVGRPLSGDGRSSWQAQPWRAC